MDRASQVTFRRNWKSRSKLYPTPYKDGLDPAVKNLSLTGEHAWIRKAHEKLMKSSIRVSFQWTVLDYETTSPIHYSSIIPVLPSTCYNLLQTGIQPAPFPFSSRPPSFCPTWQHYCTHYRPSPNRPWKFPGFLCSTRTAIVCM
jgi:hypothetical protein